VSSTGVGTRRFEPRPVPWGGLTDRVLAATTARRLVPTELALVATDLVYKTRLRFSRSRRERAEAAMAAVVGRTDRAGDVPELAREFIAAWARGWELTWRTWELERVPVRDVERLHRARAEGRGLMLAKMHMGPLGAWVPLGRVLRPLLVPSAGGLVDPPVRGLFGYRTEHWRRVFHDAGIELVRAEGSGMLLYKHLRAGGAVLMSIDMPGCARAEFLGKPVDLVGGTAELVARADALLLPVALMPLGRRWEIRIGEALDPRAFDTPDELNRTLLRVHERWVMEAPEQMGNPIPRWTAAGPDGWFCR
jgi:lauroyl/myristoyl acyltransferase